jgi:hypothetical protein
LNRAAALYWQYILRERDMSVIGIEEIFLKVANMEKALDF